MIRAAKCCKSCHLKGELLGRSKKGFATVDPGGDRATDKNGISMGSKERTKWVNVT